MRPSGPVSRRKAGRLLSWQRRALARNAVRGDERHGGKLSRTPTRYWVMRQIDPPVLGREGRAFPYTRERQTRRKAPRRLDTPERRGQVIACSRAKENVYVSRGPGEPISNPSKRRGSSPGSLLIRVLRSRVIRQAWRSGGKPRRDGQATPSRAGSIPAPATLSDCFRERIETLV